MKLEEFDAWRREPVTKFIFAAIAKAVEQEKAEWLRLSWDGGEADPLRLAELRTRADALNELIDNDFDTWINWSNADV